jgi:hypothetical protein
VRYELDDPAAGPKEEVDLAGKEPDRAGRMTAQLEEW